MSYRVTVPGSGPEAKGQSFRLPNSMPRSHRGTAMTNRIFAAVAVLVMGVALAACAGGRTRVESDLAIKGAPDWVNEGVQALDNRGGRLIHGIGSAPKMPDASLQRTTADDRARAEVARVLSSFMNVVSQDYIASADYGDRSVEARGSSRQSDNLNRPTMPG